jgi:hypothetical protein
MLKDSSEQVGLNIPLRFIFKPSYSPHCINTNVVGHCKTTMKPKTIHIIFLLLPNILFCQDLKTLTGVLGTEDSYEEIFISLNGGCSLSCGIGWTLSTTSTLKSQGKNTYGSENMDDGERQTAWVEGVNGYGIGEKVIIEFEGSEKSNRIPFDGFSITNGYAKNLEAWKANSRVKSFILSYNGTPIYLIELADSIFPQYVSFDSEIKVSPGDIVTLEIKDIFKGDKYSDTAISDLSLNGGH